MYPKLLTLYTPLLLSLGLSFSAEAQSLVRGVLVDEQGQPIIGASLALSVRDQAPQQSLSDQNGHFSLRSSLSGAAVLRIHSIGYSSQTLQLQLSDKQTLQLDTLVLREQQQELASIEIIGRQRRDYNSDYSYSMTKIPVKNQNLAASVSTITKELIKDRQAFQVGDAIKGASSVQQIGFYNHFNIRGITQNAFGQVVNGMRTNQIYFAQPMTQHIERIEIIKGPGSISLSSADPGGTINLVTKKPLREKRHEVGLTLGSWRTIRGQLDFTGPLNETRTLLYRLNMGVQKAASFRDLIDNNGLLLAPSLSYLPSPQTAINLELSYTQSQGKLDRGQPTFGNTETRADLLRTPISMFMGAASDYYHTSELIATLSLSQQLSQRLKFNAQYMKQLWTEDMKEHRSNRRFVRTFVAGQSSERGGGSSEVPNLVQLRYHERTQRWYTDALNAYLSYEWAAAGTKNTTILGYDLNYLQRPKGNGSYEARGLAKDAQGNILPESYVHPKTGQSLTIQRSLAGYYDLEGKNQELKLAKDLTLLPKALPIQNYATHSAYLQNLSQWGPLHLILGLRHEWVVEEELLSAGDTSREVYTKLIPRVGLSYALDKHWSLYATYLQGFQSQSQAFEATPVLANNLSESAAIHLAPLESQLLEAGVKMELLKGRLRGTLSLFEIKQRNIPMKDLDDQITLRGADRSRGLELELAGYLSPELQLSAAYSYIDAVITEDPSAALIGQRKEAAPRHNASLWAKYSFLHQSPLQGLSLGLGLQHSSDRLSWYERNLTLPAYTVLDAVLGYKPRGGMLEFALKVNNLLNTTYWTGALDKTWIFPGSPRNFMLSTSCYF